MRPWQKEIEPTPERLEVEITYSLPYLFANNLIAGAVFKSNNDALRGSVDFKLDGTGSVERLRPNRGRQSTNVCIRLAWQGRQTLSGKLKEVGL